MMESVGPPAQFEADKRATNASTRLQASSLASRCWSKVRSKNEWGALVDDEVVRYPGSRARPNAKVRAGSCLRVQGRGPGVLPSRGIVMPPGKSVTSILGPLTRKPGGINLRNRPPGRVTRGHHAFALIAARFAFVDPVPRAPPLPPLVALRAQAATLRRLPERSLGQLCIGQGRQRHKARRPCDGRHDESHERVEHGARDELTQRPLITGVCAPQVVEVLSSLGLEDDRWRIGRAAACYVRVMLASQAWIDQSATFVSKEASSIESTVQPSANVSRISACVTRRGP